MLLLLQLPLPSPHARLFFHVVIIVCGTLHICPCGMCGVGRRVQQPACICGIIMRVLLKLQLQRKSHSNILNIMQHGNMQQGEPYRNNHSHCPEGVLFILVSSRHELDTATTTAGQQDCRTAGLQDTTLGQSDSGCPADCLIRRTQYT